MRADGAGLGTGQCGITIVSFTQTLVLLPLETTESPSRESGRVTGAEKPEAPIHPTEPSLTLLLESNPFVVPSELAKTGIGPCTARLPTGLHRPRGTAWAPIPPPGSRARYRWYWHQDYKRGLRHRIPQT
ncbi:putative protein E4 [Rangifer tarandus papillomavirus 1]|uniref:E4 n=1 Tax=Rangifer tarandus papillomavirus 1 TaxID=2773313 RepID=Q8BDR1_9PAPI|nr:putative protein E4 [Rangifer tarandus papillomavirus 1]